MTSCLPRSSDNTRLGYLSSFKVRLSIQFIMWRVLGLLTLVCMVSAERRANFGPSVVPTKGEPWPLPTSRDLKKGFLILRPSNFTIGLNSDCGILIEAARRYRDEIIKREAEYAGKEFNGNTISEDPKIRELEELNINVDGSCEIWPHLHMDESYSLKIIGESAHLYAPSVWGAFRGLETFSQLLVAAGQGSNLKVRKQVIDDAPKLPHRGLLLDTSHHFFPLSDIKLILETMAFNKLNVFHWHIIGDNSFPYKSEAFPELSKKGSYHPHAVYSAKDIKSVIEYARLRGIRVIPEFDPLGLVRSWLKSNPDFLTTCYDKNGQPIGPIDPSNKTIWTFLKILFKEVMNLFQDEYIHLGQDEVPSDCWKRNKKIMKAFIKELLNITAKNKKKSIVWQELFDNVIMKRKPVVQVWKGSWARELAEATSKGHPVLLSACWLLDHVADGGEWQKDYSCDPLAFNGTDVKKRLMLGGEACMRSEFVGPANVHQSIWPRTCATAERLWSQSIDTIQRASERLEEHACRMRRRGIPAQPPNGPSSCYYEEIKKIYTIDHNYKYQVGRDEDICQPCDYN